LCEYSYCQPHGGTHTHTQLRVQVQEQAQAVTRNSGVKLLVVPLRAYEGPRDTSGQAGRTWSGGSGGCTCCARRQA
jgi:hypothetical protein